MSSAILVIEDNKKHSIIFEDILIDEGYEVETAGNEKEVRQKMAESIGGGKHFDLLLVDIAVPEFDAIDFIKKYKETHRILVVSAYADRKDVSELLDAKWRIKKPFDDNIFIERVKEILSSTIDEVKK
jgi:DNA-binding response OmpR family regulator